MREDNAEERGALPGALARLEDSGRRRAAMVAVGNVKSRNPAELGFDETDAGRVGDHPGGVTHAVVGGEVDARRLGGLQSDDYVHGPSGAVAQEDRAGLDRKS